MSSRYDTRSHDERIRDLVTSLEKLKAKATLSGKINDCSISKVCKMAKVSDSYLYTCKLKNQDMNKRYHKVRQEISDFREQFQDPTSNSTLLEISTAKIERNRAHEQLALQVELNLQLENTIEILNQRLRQAEDKCVSVSAMNLNSNNVPNSLEFNIEPHIISLPTRLYVAESSSKKSLDLKRYKDLALRELKRVLERNLPQRMYVLIGTPFAGKTVWAKNRQYYTDRHPVIIDYPNLNSSDRSIWLTQAYKYSKNNSVKTCAVYFNSDLQTLLERQKSCTSANKLTEQEVCRMLNMLEPPEVHEGFDEILIIDN